MYDDDSAPVPSPRVTRIEHDVPRRPERVRVHLDDGGVLEAARDVVLERGLSVGDPVDDRLRAHLGDADVRWRAREAALRLLSHRARSRTELARRLVRKDFPAPVVRACLDELAERGLIDDDAFARSWIRDRLRLKPRGRGALLAELRRKGVETRIAEAALADVFREEEVREEDLVVEVALGWLRRQGARVRRDLTRPRFSDEGQRARRRLVGYLGRRGFRGGTLGRGVEAAERAARADGG